MMPVQVYLTAHEREVDAPAGVLYGLIADSVHWPLFLPSTVHVERLDFDGTDERMRIWAQTDGTVMSWVSQRRLDPVLRRIEFRQEVPAPPLESMNGSWTVDPVGSEDSRLTLRHDFTVRGSGGSAAAAWVQRVTEANSKADAGRLASMAAQWTRLDDLVLHFTESTRIEGPWEPVYDFLYRCADWPHYRGEMRADVTEQQPGVQLLRAGIRDGDGPAREAWVRICFPHAGRIVCKELQPAPPVAAHIVEWQVTQDETGVSVSAEHTVALDGSAPQAAAGSAVAAARRQVRRQAGDLSALLLRQAAAHARNAVRVL